MVFSDGSKCKTSQGETTDIRASTVVDFVCNPAIFGPGQPKLVAQLPPGDEEEACAFVIEWETHVRPPFPLSILCVRVADDTI
jgi:cation-dependent mannose-6-phosphate receptor